MNRTVIFKPVFTQDTKGRLAQRDVSIVPDWAKHLPSALVRLMLSQRGAAGAWVFTNVGRTKLLDGTFDIENDSYKMALHLSTSNIGAGSTTWAGVDNEHAAANGYDAGGIAVTLVLSGTTTVKVDIDTDPVWTANGGSIVARFAVIYEVGGDVLCYCLLDDTPADVTATDGNTLTVAAHASGVFTLA